MCGATNEQKSLEAKQAAFYDTMTSHYKEVFGKQQGILDDLTAMFRPILAKGPDQEGYGPEEKAALETQATEGVATGYAEGERALNEKLAARGGDDFIPSGENAQLESGLQSMAANERANLKNKITVNDYAQGRANFSQAAEVLGGVAAQDNPVGTAGAANQAGKNAADTANEIAMANNSIWGSVLGAVGGVAGAYAGKPPSDG